VPVSSLLIRLGTYPFVHLDEAKRRVASTGVELLDFGAGDPREVAPAPIRKALADSLDAASGYPAAQGLPELRAAVSAWCRRRFGVALDPDSEIIPTLGSKEAIFSLAQVVVDRSGDRRLVLVTEPGYPVPHRGALVAGAEPVSVPLLERNRFLPDLEAIPDRTWEQVALAWINYPNNPTGATAPPAFFERLAGLARKYNFVLASDEAYSELWFDEPPSSALQGPDRRNVLVFNSLSKRSSMTGYRSGFAAGDPELIAALRAFRPNIGTAPQEFVQRASIVAWEDEVHVERTREAYRRKREIFLELFERKGLRVPASEATMYLWVGVPSGEDSEGFAGRLVEHGVVVSPGPFFGEAGEGYVRLALVPSLDACRRAAAILEEVL
jgi:succinyldiaminopimelate transaminase